MTPQEFIADLHELKQNILTPTLDSRYIQPNVTYAVLETLIAAFMDKYSVKYKDLQEVFRERSFKNDELLNN